MLERLENVHTGSIAIIFSCKIVEIICCARILLPTHESQTSTICLFHFIKSSKGFKKIGVFVFKSIHQYIAGFIGNTLLLNKYTYNQLKLLNCKLLGAHIDK